MDCHKTHFCQHALEKRGLANKLAKVDKDSEAAKELAGAGLVKPGFFLNERSKRFIRYMKHAYTFVNNAFAVEVFEHLRQADSAIRLKPAQSVGATVKV